MDELSILREQISLERRHMAAVRTACREALSRLPAPQAGTESSDSMDAFFVAARRYLLYSLRRFHAQDAAHLERLRGARSAVEPEAQRALDDLAGALDALLPALAALESAPNPAAGCRDFVRYFDAQLTPRRHMLNPLIEGRYTIDDWRAVSFVDADSILEERRHFAAVRGALPPGVSLDEASARPAATG